MPTNSSHVSHAEPSTNGTAQPAGQLTRTLASGDAVIGVVGLGYVGLPLASEYAAQGYRTIGFDVDAERVRRLNSGENYIQDVDSAVLRQAVAQDLFAATVDFGALPEADVIYICVPTPVTDHKDPDTSYIEAASKAIAQHLRAGQLVILKSTTFPGTTEDLIQPILAEAAAERGLTLGTDYFLAFSPERIDPGNKKFTTTNTPVVVGGVTPACQEVATMALEQVVEQIHPVSSAKAAEMEKLLENIFRNVNIALVNELAQLCDRMGDISVWEVIEAAATKPFGFMPFYPGPGIGGHCIPVDPHYLSWLARKHDFETSFITLSARINEQMPFHVVNAITKSIAEQPIRLREAKVLLLGAAFKKNVSDTRHAPIFSVMEALRHEGVQHVDYSDPHVPTLHDEASPREAPLTSVDLTPDAIADHDVVVILTDHDAFPYDLIVEHAPAVIDTRNALSAEAQERDTVRLLGGGGRWSQPSLRQESPQP